MKKSLLEILEEEKQAVVDERFYADSLKDFVGHTEEENAIMKSYEGICISFEQKRKEAEERILAARMEIKEYISEIEKLI